ncbi:signal recognition particle 68 kda protein-like protein [Xylogone sp. PMI_703]|nr:signal recognition particle 68 kda protein-like protein [Xylogone sp. PMI_703]
MEITKFVVSGREKALLYGDYSSYRAQLSNRIHNLRKRLDIATKPRAKYIPKAPITTEDISRSHDFVYLLLLTSERAWANAESMKSVHSTDNKGITGSTRSHIISRLYKAAKCADSLFQLLKDQSQTGASDTDVLEARAYAASLNGDVEFAKQSWEPSLKSYSEARIIYDVLATSTKSDIFKDLVAGRLDPFIRYAAYQMRMSRTIAVPAIARQYFPTSDNELVSQLKKFDDNFLNNQDPIAKTESTDSVSAPKTITWRSRTVDLEDATITTALVAVRNAVEQLSKILSTRETLQPKDKAAGYDDILIASQDAVDATKHAIDELTAEKVGQGDKRMQSLQITRTAVSYDMISWRIGRNRVLVGDKDGAIDSSVTSTNKKSQKSAPKPLSTGHRLAQFRERVVLYDGILQSLDSIKELPGVAGDSAFLEELGAKYNYFQALKCLTIARSHALVSNNKNALALLNRASEKCTSAYSHLSSAMDTSDASPPSIAVSGTEVQFLKDLLQGEVQRYRALVELGNIITQTETNSGGFNSKPLVEQLNEYPVGEVDLKNLVAYPPKLEPVPVKPLFFDAAWNYIEYPDRKVEASQETATQNAVSDTAGAEPQPQAQQKKGWFGFGR